MNHLALLLAAATVAAAGIVTGGTAVAADLAVSVGTVRDAAGQVKVVLYDRPDAFRKEAQSRAIQTVPAVPGMVEVVFRDLPAGTYAIMAYHDEDASGDLNRFLGMIPTEGYALSNDPEVTGPPSFEASAFALPAAGSKLKLTLRY